MPYTRYPMSNPHHYQHDGHTYPRAPHPSMHQIRASSSWEHTYPGPRPLAPLGHSNYQSQYHHYRYQGSPYQPSSPPDSFHSYCDEEFRYQYPPNEQGSRSYPPNPADRIQKQRFSFSRPQTSLSQARTFSPSLSPTDSATAETSTHAIRDEDVVCGRGAPSLHHPGNIYFRQVIQQFQSRYLAARRIDKPAIASRVVEIIQERGGEFIKRSKTGGGWEAIGEHRAYEKACQALREGAPELRRKLAAREIAAAAICLDRLSSSERGPAAGSDDDDGRDESNSSGRGGDCNCDRS